MIALVRYLAVDLLRSQRYLPPLLLHCAVLGMMFSGDAGDALFAYAGSCALIYPVAAWFGVVVATTEDPIQRTVTAVTAGGWGRVAVAQALLAAVGVVVLSVIATVWPVVTNPHPYSLAEVGLGAVAHLVCGFTGVGVGMLCSRPVIGRAGPSLLAVVAVVAVTFKVGQATPVGAVLGGLAHRDLGALPVAAVAAVLLVAVDAVAGWRLGPRRA
ncbi:hypothetical protein ACFFQW_47615 [Umezawaea endophytica]|uniref:hypothetical protein n=1 Tax=Umezawaea endophytica TaxID=1654476 RepID=UPI0035EB55C8